MNLREFKKRQKENQIIKGSYISDEVLYQCREITPERRIVAKDGYCSIVFFEETSASLQKRHYNKADKPTSFNLLYNDGEKTHKVTEKYLLNTVLYYTEGYDIDVLLNFLKNNNRRFNALEHEKRRKCSFFLTDNEIDAVKELVKRMRELKGDRQ